MMKKHSMAFAVLAVCIAFIVFLSLPSFLKGQEEKAWRLRYEEKVQKSAPVIAEEAEKILDDFSSSRESLTSVADQMKSAGIKYISSCYELTEMGVSLPDGFVCYKNEEINQVFPELWDTFPQLALPCEEISDCGEYVSFYVRHIDPFYNFHVSFRLLYGDKVQDNGELVSRYVNYGRYKYIDPQWMLIWDIRVMRE